jgi:hypothetical protein
MSTLCKAAKDFDKRGIKPLNPETYTVERLQVTCTG